MSQYTVAVLGATGVVGSHLIHILEERNFPVKTLKPLASKRSLGTTVTFKGQELPVEEATPEAFEGVDLVLASAGASISEKLVPEAVKRGAVVVDNTSFYRYDPNIPLVVAGVNDEDVDWHTGIIANPNCSTAQLMPVFKALHQVAPLKRVVVSTYQSVSGAGKEGIDRLSQENKAVSSGAPLPGGDTPFSRQIAYNLIPQIDAFQENGYTKEEMKVTWETRKILHLPELPVACTAVRVPVSISHSEAVNLEFQTPLSPAEAIAILKKTPDVVVSEIPQDFPTPLDAAGKDPVYVGRIREDISCPGTGLVMWVVADNLRIGAALNAVRIAEVLDRRGKLNSAQSKAVASV